MTDITVSSADLTALARDAEKEAAKRNLVVLPAMMRTEAQVVFPHPQVTLGQVFDVAVESAAPFVAIDLLPFTAVDFLAEAAAEAEGIDDLPEDILADAAEHEGDPSTLWVRWVAAGTAYTFWARTAWHENLADRLEAWVDGAAEAEDTAATARAEQVSALSDLAVLRPELRAAKASDRKRVADIVIREAAEPDDSDEVIDVAVNWAVTRIREDAASAYYELSQDVVGVAAEVAGQDGWNGGRETTGNRRAFIRDYLIGRTGGYAPTDVLVKQVDAAAEAR